MRKSVCITSIIISVFIASVILVSCGGGGGGGGSTPLAPISLLSVNGANSEGNLSSSISDISSNGRYVAFQSAAENLVAGDSNAKTDIFLRDTDTGINSRVSVSAAGTEGNDHSYNAAISDDGRYVAFESRASNLVPGDTNGVWDIFVYDTNTAMTSRVSVSSAGTEANGTSYKPAISADGRYVAFESVAANLVANDTNSNWDVFVHDTTTGTTSLVSQSTVGNLGNAASYRPALSSDGKWVTFESFASNLTFFDSNSQRDVFLHDTTLSITSRVSVSTFDTQGNNTSGDPSISSGGRYIAFESLANTLVGNDTNGVTDIFVHDTTTGITSRVSVSTAGTGGNSHSGNPSISSDGRYVAFDSGADNLVANDTNVTDDIFVHDTFTGVTSRASVSQLGVEGDDNSYNPAFSSDGEYVAFESGSTNLITGRTLTGTTHIFKAPRP